MPSVGRASVVSSWLVLDGGHHPGVSRRFPLYEEPLNENSDVVGYVSAQEPVNIYWREVGAVSNWILVGSVEDGLPRGWIQAHFLTVDINDYLASAKLTGRYSGP